MVELTPEEYVKSRLTDMHPPSFVQIMTDYTADLLAKVSEQSQRIDFLESALRKRMESLPDYNNEYFFIEALLKK